MSNEKDSNPKEKKSGNGEHKYPELITDGFKPDPDVPGRYTYVPDEDTDTYSVGFLDCDELLKGLTSIKWLVRGYIEENCTGMFFGAPESYKSFLLIDLCLCVASGRAWHGLPVKQGPVAYICGEGHQGIGRRVAAWFIHNGIDRTGIPFIVSKKAGQLLLDESILAIRADIDHKLHAIPKLIAIDTLARNFGAGKENATEDMNQFVNNVDLMFRAAYGSTVIISHHSGHSERQRARGSSVLNAGIDFEYMADRIEDSVIFKNTKMKDGPRAKPIFFDTVPIDLPLAEEDGTPSTSLVLQINEGGPPTDRGIHKKGETNLSILIDAFEKCLKAANKNLADQERELVDYVLYSVWRDEIKMDRKRFYDAKEALLESRILKIKDRVFVSKGVNWDDDWRPI